MPTPNPAKNQARYAKITESESRLTNHPYFRRDNYLCLINHAEIILRNPASTVEEKSVAANQLQVYESLLFTEAITCCRP